MIDSKIDRKIDSEIDRKINRKIDRKVDRKIDRKMDRKIDRKIFIQITNLQMLGVQRQLFFVMLEHFLRPQQHSLRGQAGNLEGSILSQDLDNLNRYVYYRQIKIDIMKERQTYRKKIDRKKLIDITIDIQKNKQEEIQIERQIIERQTDTKKID